MNIYGKAYNEILYSHVVPLSDVSIQYDKLEYWTFKYYLRNLSCGTEVKKNGKSFCLTIPLKDFHKILVAESELFISKANMQFYEANYLKHFSTNWHFVSLYYSFFFYTCAFFRFLHRGYIYVDKSISQILETNVNLGSSPVKVPTGNFYFSKIKETGDKVIVALTAPSGRMTSAHEVTWMKLGEILRSEFLPNTSPSGDNEFQILDRIKEINSLYEPRFPSETRNKYNYPPESGLTDLKKELEFCFSHNYTLENFLKTDFKESEDAPDKVKATIYYFKFVMSYVRKYYEEYESRFKNKTDLYERMKKFESGKK